MSIKGLHQVMESSSIIMLLYGNHVVKATHPMFRVYVKVGGIVGVGKSMMLVQGRCASML